MYVEAAAASTIYSVNQDECVRVYCSPPDRLGREGAATSVDGGDCRDIIFAILQCIHSVCTEIPGELVA